jgi:glycosyltransferase involved in cell wall biosynthesis
MNPGSMRRALLDLVRKMGSRLGRYRHARLVEKVAAAKKARTAAPEQYNDAPRLSMIVLSFNHRRNIQPILAGLRRTSGEELIVCEDGSIDGSEGEWSRLLTRPNDFLIRSNDIHEIRTYDRAARFARGQFFCVLQDDDIPPENGAWVDEALGLLERYPRLGVLGAFQGWVLQLQEPTDAVIPRAVFGYRGGAQAARVADIPTVDPVSGTPFMFVEGVSVGPIFYRSDVFRALGGFDHAYSRPGEPGILFDHELCLRAWLSGWQVGLFDPPPFQKYVGGQGTKLFGAAARSRNARDNVRRLHRDYGRRIGEIERTVRELNSKLEARRGL